MNLSEYIQLALRTEGRDSEGNLFEPGKRLRHAVSGLGSELAELIEGDNYVEEIGDMMWYLNLGFDAVGLSLDGNYGFIEAEAIPMEELPVLIGKLLDITKRNEFYGEELFEKNKKDIIPADLARGLLNQYLADVYAIIEDNELDLHDILFKNIKKLEKRYPKLRFEASHALDRNLDKEQATFN